MYEAYERDGTRSGTLTLNDDPELLLEELADGFAIVHAFSFGGGR
jgi:hypothetical protein